MPPGAWMVLGMGLLAHVIASVWWASHINTLLGIQSKLLEQLAKEISLMRASYVSKEEFAYRTATSDKEHQAMWKQLDELKERER